MVKHVLRDYIYQWRNIKERRSWEGLALVCGWLFGPTLRGFEACPRLIGILYMGLPFCVAYLLSRMYPNELPMMAHLSPMTRKEKKKYLLIGFFVRIIVPIVIYGMLTAWIIRIGVPLNWHMLADFVVFVPTVITLNIYVRPPKEDSMGLKGMKGFTESMTVCEFASYLIALFATMSLKANILDGFTLRSTLFEQEAKVLAVLSIVICLYMCIRYYPIIMSIGIGYREDIEKEGENR